MMPERPLLLLLGGTAEARALAEAVVAAGRWRVITSLAGRTEAPRRPPGEVRQGGFGGVAGLRHWLRENQPTAVIDATHPFAATISAHAAEACAAEGVPRLLLQRPAWRADPAWVRVPTLAAAAERLPRLDRRAFLTVGSGDLGLFAGLAMELMLARVVTPPDPLPSGLLLEVARGPFDQSAEEDLMRRYGIDVLVTKASGGPGTAAKLAAARTLGVTVLMIDRPAPPPGPAVPTVDAAVAWLAAQA